MPLKLLSSGGGSVLLTANTTASDFTVNVPAVNGNMVTTADTGSITQSMLGAGVYAGYGPAFSAYMSSNQSYTAPTYTKLQMNTKHFDTANCFDTSLYRFTPNVAGYYFLNAQAEFQAVGNRSTLYLYKNGSLFLTGLDAIGNGVNAQGSIFSGLVYANGSTDYFEIYFQANNNGSVYGLSNGAGIVSYFQAFLARAA